MVGVVMSSRCEEWSARPYDGLVGVSCFVSEDLDATLLFKRATAVYNCNWLENKQEPNPTVKSYRE